VCIDNHATPASKKGGVLLGLSGTVRRISFTCLGYKSQILKKYPGPDSNRHGLKAGRFYEFCWSFVAASVDARFLAGDLVFADLAFLSCPVVL
jgi:hypothetical protein